MKYIDLEEYIRQGEPQKREKGIAWQTAIGLQEVDGLKTSSYLNQLAKRNIAGEITFSDVKRLLDEYYECKNSIKRITKEKPIFTLDDLTTETNLPMQNLANQLVQLQEEGVIRRVGSDKTGHWEVIG